MSEKLERRNIDKSKIDWNEHADYWDDFDDAKVYTRHTFDLLSERVNLENLTILDFGSGTGLLTEYMGSKARQIVAIDSSKRMIDVLNGKNLSNVKTIVNELSEKTVKDNPVLNNKFDVIVASSVCAFLPNYEEVLSIIKSLLKPNGIFVQWDWLRTEKDPGFGFTEEIIREKFRSVGLNVESISIPFHIMENDEKMEVIMSIGKL